MSDTPTHDRFTISYRDGAYKVSIPNYDGGEVVSAAAYDQLSALCAQMAAALEEIKKRDTEIVEGGAIRDAAGGIIDAFDTEEVSGPCAKIATRALTAYRTLSPGPQWQRVPEGAGVCAFDRDECTVTLALDTEAQVNAFISGLLPKKRVRLMDDESSARGEG